VKIFIFESTINEMSKQGIKVCRCNNVLLLINNWLRSPALSANLNFPRKSRLNLIVKLRYEHSHCSNEFPIKIWWKSVPGFPSYDRTSQQTEITLFLSRFIKWQIYFHNLCRSCPPCRDMVKYGGMGRMRQSCVKRHCARPLLPVAAQCSVCQLDGWNQTPDPKKIVDLVIFLSNHNFQRPSVCLTKWRNAGFTV